MIGRGVSREQITFSTPASTNGVGIRPPSDGDDGDDGSEVRKFRNLSRELLNVSARERAKEMAVFALVVIAAAWPVIYTVIVVVKLLATEHPSAE